MIKTGARFRLFNISLEKQEIFEILNNIDDKKNYEALEYTGKTTRSINSFGINLTHYLHENDYTGIIYNEFKKGQYTTKTIEPIQDSYILKSTQHIKANTSNIYNIVYVNLLNSQGNDVIEIQHLINLLFQLGKESVFLYFYCNESDRYRYSTYINLLCLYLNIYNNVTFIINNNKRISCSRAILLQDNISEEFLPIIVINNAIYSFLSSHQQFSKNSIDLSTLEKEVFDQKRKAGQNNENSTLNQDLINNIYKNILKIYIQQAINLEWDIENWEIKEQQLLENKQSILFLIIYSTIKNKTNIFTKADISYESFIELCYSYSQGILQIIENALLHAVIKQNSTALFGFRVHHKDNSNSQAYNKYLNNFISKKSPLSQIPFLDIMISDFPNNRNINFKNIVNNFNEKLSNPAITSLEQIFNYPQTKHKKSPDELINYYENEKNIANHYGLQIFSIIITANSGLFLVESNKDYYTNYSEVKKFYKKDFPQSNKSLFKGTNYSILLPIYPQRNKTLSPNTPLNVDNLSKSLIINENEISSVYFKDLCEYINIDEIEKESIIEHFVSKLIDEFDNTLLIIDLLDTNITFRLLECLSKASFIVIANSQKIKCLSITNIYSQENFLEIFRFYLLFYNRHGECKYLNDKCIYLVDSTLNNDLFMEGGDLPYIFNKLTSQRFFLDIPKTLVTHVTTLIEQRRI